MRLLNKSIYFVLRLWKHLKDYERGLEHFRGKEIEIEKFEAWRAIMANRLHNNFIKDSDGTSEAARTLAQIDPAMATLLDASIRRLEFTYPGPFAKLVDTDRDRYVQLIYNQDYIIDLALSDFRKAAMKLASRSGVAQQWRVHKYLRAIERGSKEFNEGMEEQAEMLKKVVAP